ncbi:MAG: GNAT family N-acetyltransferase [Treponema sp.]|nr:GNAT family N-acetyltransferase [Treponema sp.]
MSDSCVHSITGGLDVKRLNKYFGLAKKALAFVFPYENICCRLYEMIEQNPQDVCAIIDSSGNIHGVFSYTRGQLVLPCLPYDDEKIRLTLQSFFYNNKVFCLSGKSEFCDIITKAIDAAATQSITEKRLYLFLECGKPLELKEIPGIKYIKCNKRNSNALFPVQLEYIKEEVLPENMELKPAVERLALDRLLKKEDVRALVTDDGKIYAKAQINAKSPHFELVGGVYTVPDQRGKGLASYLMSCIEKEIYSRGKSTVLFANKDNTAALALYRSLGFEYVCGYTISYF